MVRKKHTISKPTEQYQCRDCAKSYDWHSKAIDGHLILCRCEHYTNGKWCKFLSDAQCEHFILKKEQ